MRHRACFAGVAQIAGKHQRRATTAERKPGARTRRAIGLRCDCLLWGILAACEFSPALSRFLASALPSPPQAPPSSRTRTLFDALPRTLPAHSSCVPRDPIAPAFEWQYLSLSVHAASLPSAHPSCTSYVRAPAFRDIRRSTLSRHTGPASLLAATNYPAWAATSPNDAFPARGQIYQPTSVSRHA
ncbi:hypothetical protein K466DRAFT_297403 [Polyporus arcularius HHB13444]|uniref:Uncharacterized protein n=1 Tax=Polyporus arcularius HHB13444 TaxID=1314778 RepID=A0A5C3P9R7_9APHY|nr:hypothetical protein K466DRAFT_297403 [Polyporus arcularius HHB13444]